MKYLLMIYKKQRQKLFNLSEQLGSDDELGKAWYIVYKRLQKEKEAKMKSEN